MSSTISLAVLLTKSSSQERDQVLVDGQAWDREEFTAYWGKLWLEGQIVSDSYPSLPSEPLTYLSSQTALLKATLGPEEKQIGPSAQ